MSSSSLKQEELNLDVSYEYNISNYNCTISVNDTDTAAREDNANLANSNYYYQNNVLRNINENDLNTSVISTSSSPAPDEQRTTLSYSKTNTSSILRPTTNTSATSARNTATTTTMTTKTMTDPTTTTNSTNVTNATNNFTTSNSGNLSSMLYSNKMPNVATIATGATTTATTASSTGSYFVKIPTATISNANSNENSNLTRSSSNQTHTQQNFTSTANTSTAAAAAALAANTTTTASVMTTATTTTSTNTNTTSSTNPYGDNLLSNTLNQLDKEHLCHKSYFDHLPPEIEISVYGSETLPENSVLEADNTVNTSGAETDTFNTLDLKTRRTHKSSRLRYISKLIS
jgi:hypothetical protein